MRAAENELFDPGAMPVCRLDRVSRFRAIERQGDWRHEPVGRSMTCAKR